MEQELTYSLYLVAFIDVLGQRPLIRNLPFPDAGMEKSKITEKLKSTAGVVLGLRQTFTELFEILASPGPLLNSLPNEQMETLQKYTRCDIRFHGFSDSIAISVPITDQDESWPDINGIYACLFALCSVLLSSLAVGHPIRGGVDIGPCLSFSSSEVYGAALEKAYYLESTVADYPRIVIGKDLLNYINEIEHQTAITQLGMLAKERAKKTGRLIGCDQDGRFHLDFLGKEVREIAADIKEMSLDNAAMAVYQYALSCMQRYYTRDEKLFGRYAKLC